MILPEVYYSHATTERKWKECANREQDRTSELRKKGFEGRRLGPKQMTTDTAVRVTRMVVEQKCLFLSALGGNANAGRNVRWLTQIIRCLGPNTLP